MFISPQTEFYNYTTLFVYFKNGKITNCNEECNICIFNKTAFKILHRKNLIQTEISKIWRSNQMYLLSTVFIVNVVGLRNIDQELVYTQLDNG